MIIIRIIITLLLIIMSLMVRYEIDRLSPSIRPFEPFVCLSFITLFMFAYLCDELVVIKQVNIIG